MTTEAEQFAALTDRQLLEEHRKYSYAISSYEEVVKAAKSRMAVIEALLLQRAVASGAMTAGYDGSTFIVQDKEFFSVSGEERWGAYCSFILSEVVRERNPNIINSYLTKAPMRRTLKDLYETTGTLPPGAERTVEAEIKIKHAKG